MKLLHFGATFWATILSSVPFHASVTALEPDYPCFLITQSGQVVDLSDSLCRAKGSTPQVSSNRQPVLTKAKKSNTSDQDKLRQKALQQIHNTSKKDVPAVTDAYIPR